MTQNSTQELLLAYLFDELRPSERNCLEHYLISSSQLQQDLTTYARTIDQLKLPLLEPSEQSVKLLMDYAAAD